VNDTKLTGRPAAAVTAFSTRTVLKALAARVPLVVAPLGRDQPDIAARVVHAGAGLRVRKDASTAALQAAIGRVLDDDRYRAGARRMAAVLAAERDDGLAVDELERAATRTRPAAQSPADAPSHAHHNRGEAGHRVGTSRPAAQETEPAWGRTLAAHPSSCRIFVLLQFWPRPQDAAIGPATSRRSQAAPTTKKGHQP
jgi:hypothetical protein